MGDQGEMENVDVHTNPFLEIINLLVVYTVQVLFFVFKKNCLEEILMQSFKICSLIDFLLPLMLA